MEYDSVLHVGADMEFINRFFMINSKDLEHAKAHITEYYTKEYKWNLQKSDTSREKSLANVLNNRNLALIERAYATFRVKQIEKENVGLELPIQDALDKAELNYVICESNLAIEEKTISLLRGAGFVESGMIWGKERNILDYQQQYKKRNVKTEDEKNPVIEELKTDLEMAQAQLENIYNNIKERELNDQYNLGGGIKR